MTHHDRKYGSNHDCHAGTMPPIKDRPAIVKGLFCARRRRQQASQPGSPARRELAWVCPSRDQLLPIGDMLYAVRCPLPESLPSSALELLTECIHKLALMIFSPESLQLRLRTPQVGRRFTTRLLYRAVMSTFPQQSKRPLLDYRVAICGCA